MTEENWRAQIDSEIDRLRSQINEAAVCTYASSLNGGRACNIEHTDLMGCANYHARIRFHDGSRSWLLRVPRVTGFIGGPEPLAAYLVVSEYATLKFLEKTTVPAPRAFGYGTCSDGNDHGVGVSFLLVEELPGKAWTGGGTPADEKTREQKAKIWSGLADILADLTRHPFPKAGSLCMEGSRVQVGPVASDRFVVLDPEGPFENALDYYTAWAEQYLALIADRQLYTAYPVDAYLVYRFLKENAGQLVQDEGKAKGKTTASGGFFLKHVDDHGGHLLLDDDDNITGIIDWQMARVVPRAEAFGPSLISVDMSALGRGRVSLGVDDAALVAALREKGHRDLARGMGDENEKARRFFWGLALEVEWKYALPEANAILKAFGVQQTWEEWRDTVLREYSADKRLQALMRACPPKRLSLPRRCKRARRT
jgi:aminoglycoside phosphotransferase (APT) family kinase protein